VSSDPFCIPVNDSRSCTFSTLRDLRLKQAQAWAYDHVLHLFSTLLYRYPSPPMSSWCLC
jgi:hypothetical protein